MATTARDELARILTGHGTLKSSNAQLPITLDQLRVHVEGVGDLQFPVRAAQAKRLRANAIPAPFGFGTHTLTDPAVRDTWQVPTELVRVDWGGQLKGVLDAARSALSLPPESRLTTELHSMLVYEPGQFFTWHQDSEKTDAMVASLVVMLPSAFTGGELVIQHGDSVAEYAGSKTEPTAVVFYADRFHEIREVRTGRRIALTFNLLLDEVPAAEPELDAAAVARIARLLDEHFNTPQRSRWRRHGEKARRVVYLLDHQYTEKGLAWSRLKGVDAERARLLRTAAEQAGCDFGLALVHIHEIWQVEPGVPDYGGSWAYHDEEDFDAHEDKDVDAANEADDVEVSELIESEVSLTHWRVPVDHSIEPVSLGVWENEICASIPTADMRPYEAHHEGFMGNYGNTVDRWYRRAAVLVWPRELAFANLAEAHPAKALDDLLGRADRGRTESLSSDVNSLAPFWERSVKTAADPCLLLGKAVRLATVLPAADAELLLSPFQIDALRPDQMGNLATLADRHGLNWVDTRLAEWISHARVPYGPDRLEQWITTLPDLCAALLDLHVAPSGQVAKSMLPHAWEGLATRLRVCLREERPSVRAERLASLGPVLARLVEAAAIIEGPPLDDRILDISQADDDLIDCLLPMLRIASRWAEGVRDRSGIAQLATHTAGVLDAQLARTPREPDDWSLTPLQGCDCDICTRLNTFLANRTQRQLEWPLAKPGRQHVHSRIDQAELPVTHQTRRTGRPYTLVLKKTPALFDRERQAWNQARADLDWLTAQWPDIPSSS